MEEKKSPKGKKMDASFLTLFVIAVILFVIASCMDGWQLPLAGLVAAGQMLWHLLPRLLLGFALAGMIQVVIPTEYIAKMIGEGSGLKGLTIGIVAGALTPGGPFVNFPIVASLYQSGAGVGPLAAYLTAWGMIGINRTIIYEIPLLGAHFAVARYAVSIFLPFIAGIITPVLFKLMR